MRLSLIIDTDFIETAARSFWAAYVSPLKFVSQKKSRFLARILGRIETEMSRLPAVETEVERILDERSGSW